MTGLSLAEHDMQQAVDVAAACSDEGGDGDLLPWRVLEELFELVRCDALAAWHCAPTLRDDEPSQDWPRSDGRMQEEPAPDDAFWAHFWESSCSYPDRTGDLVSVTMTSDFYSQREYHDSGMYVDYARYWDVEHELMVCLPAGPGRTLRLLFGRGAGPDFNERDRSLLTLLRPHVQAAYVAGERRRQGVSPLTARQREILQYVAAGLSNRAIARRLGLSESTVGKHLENVFARLDVSSRTAAVSRAGLAG